MKWQVAYVSKLVQADAAVITYNDLRHTTIVAPKALPGLRRQLQGTACKIANDVLVTNHDDVSFRRVSVVVKR